LRRQIKKYKKETHSGEEGSSVPRLD